MKLYLTVEQFTAFDCVGTVSNSCFLTFETFETSAVWQKQECPHQSKKLNLKTFVRGRTRFLFQSVSRNTSKNTSKNTEKYLKVQKISIIDRKTSKKAEIISTQNDGQI